MITSNIPLLEISDRQDLYSMAYVRALIATAGFYFSKSELDRKSDDLSIEYPDAFDLSPMYSRLVIQVKCTYTHEINSDETIHFPLPVRNYDHLRNSLDPRILVVVLVPRPDRIPPIPWIECKDDDTIFRHRAYWISLHGEPTTTNSETVTIKVPISNSFDVDTVYHLMNTMVFMGNKNP